MKRLLLLVLLLAGAVWYLSSTARTPWLLHESYDDGPDDHDPDPNDL